MDCDVVFQTSILPLLAAAANLGDMLLAAAPRALPSFGDALSPDARARFRARYAQEIDVGAKTFNAGVYAVNLRQWRQAAVAREVKFWMSANKEFHLWDLGTQPVLLVLAARYGWQALDARWNCNGLGYRSMSVDEIDAAWVLHWSGKQKPWLAGPNPARSVLALYASSVWAAYAPSVCSGNGECATTRGCVCTSGFSGPLCGAGVATG